LGESEVMNNSNRACKLSAVALYVKNPNTALAEAPLAKVLGAHKAKTLLTMSLSEVRVQLSDELRKEADVYICPEGAEDASWAQTFWNLPLLPQGAGAMENRLFQTYQTLKASYEKVLIVVAATPHLTEDCLLANLQVLDRDEIVIGPSEDGGFYALGGRIQELPTQNSSIRWNTAATLLDMLRTFNRASLRVGLGPRSFELSTVSDLMKLEKNLPRFYSQFIN